MSLDFEAPIVEIEQKIEELKKSAPAPESVPKDRLEALERDLLKAQKAVYGKLTPWQRVQVARHPNRPLFTDYIPKVFEEFIELHGDRCFGDDRALIGGFATIDKYKVVLIGFNKGKTVEEKVKNNFGMAHPEGYRKALRLMRLAEKFGLPVICIVDTPAAYPGASAEERGQAEAIARNIIEMCAIQAPIIAAITGEGGSGGALGIAVADSVLMFSNSIYSVIPPEGCAAILWKDSSKAPDAAEALKITADAILKLRVIDEIIEEPPGGAHSDYDAAAKSLRIVLIKHLSRLSGVSSHKLISRRVEKYEKMGRAR